MKKIITTLLFVIFSLVGSTGNRLMSEKKYEPETETLMSARFDLLNGLICSESRNYESVIDYIKLHEGFAGGKEYVCVSGRRTIGYGHVIKKGENFPPQISREFADSLLRDDFSKAYVMAQKYTPYLSGSRKLAVAHFIFSKGIGAFLGSGFRKAIRRNACVDSELVKWCHYRDRHTGRMVYSKVAASIQDWEIAMWHKDDELYEKENNYKLKCQEIAGDFQAELFSK